MSAAAAISDARGPRTRAQCSSCALEEPLQPLSSLSTPSVGGTFWCGYVLLLRLKEGEELVSESSFFLTERIPSAPSRKKDTGGEHAARTHTVSVLVSLNRSK